MPGKEILYATDYSDASQAALPLAASLARDRGATLLIAHVSQREPYPVGELFDEEFQPAEGELEELKAVVPDDPTVKFEHRLLYGAPGSTKFTNPADELLKLAEQENVEAIVVGTHGRSRLVQLLMGSVAESVVRRACCPVITVKQPSCAWQASEPKRSP